MVWKNIIEMLKKNKKAVFIGGTSFVLLAGIVGGSFYLSKITGTPKKEKVVEAVEDSVDDGGTDSTDTYWSYVSGINDIIVQVGDDVDFMEGVEWDTSLIESISVDSSDVDLTKVGTYLAVYTLSSSDGVIDTKEILVTVIGSDDALEVDTEEEEDEKENSDEEVEKEDKEKEEDSSKSNKKDKDNTSKGSNKGNTSQKVEPTETIKPETNTGSSSPEKPSTTTKPTQKPEVTPTPSPKPTEKPVHNHTWVDITEVIEHPALMGKETRVVKEAWTETVPVYEDVYKNICNGCGADITGNEYAHDDNHLLNGEKGGWHGVWETVQVGTKTIEHPAVTEEVTVVVKEAWSETVVVGQKCSGCGQKK